MHFNEMRTGWPGKKGCGIQQGGVCNVTAASRLLEAGRAGRQAGKPFFFLRLVTLLDRISNS